MACETCKHVKYVKMAYETCEVESFAIGSRKASKDIKNLKEKPVRNNSSQKGKKKKKNLVKFQPR